VAQGESLIAQEELGSLRRDVKSQQRGKGRREECTEGKLRKNTGKNEVEKDEERDEWEGVIEVQRRLARGRTR
jgi:hypothetical protein